VVERRLHQLVAGIYLPAHDTHFAEHLGRGPMVDGRGTYQLAKLRAALEESPRRGLAVDVGAHVGLWTRILAMEFAAVVAIEPMAEHADCLRLNTAHQPNVTLHELALGDDLTGGRLSLERSEGIATARVSVFGDCVPASRLDDLGLSGVDFLKIDCEGFEVFVVRGGEETIRRDRPTVVIEQKKGRVSRYGVDRLAGVALLRSWGAEVKWLMAGDYCLAWGN
jgi:FkbM family methyltransferase